MFGSKRIVSLLGLAFLLVMLLHNFSHATTHNVSIVDFQFIPQTDTVTVGDTVRWTNNGAVPHTSTSNSGVWNSGTLSPGQSFSFQFNSTGSFPYHCAIHPSMTGTIVVHHSMPILTGWGLLVLVLLLLSSGIWVWRRRRSAIAVRAN